MQHLNKSRIKFFKLLRGIMVSFTSRAKNKNARLRNIVSDGTLTPIHNFSTSSDIYSEQQNEKIVCVSSSIKNSESDLFFFTNDKVNYIISKKVSDCSLKQSNRQDNNKKLNFDFDFIGNLYSLSLS
jgi:hypothetical protein